MSAFVKCGHFDAELGWNVPDSGFPEKERTVRVPMLADSLPKGHMVS
jgi:hypothetical protein